MSQRYEVAFRIRIGPSQNDDKSIRILNRVVTWTDDGIEYEADQWHAEIIVRDSGLCTEAKPVVTPGNKPSEIISEDNDEDELMSHEASLYRALVARANYLAQDRSDITFAVKELSRCMSAPRVIDMKAMKRLARYLVDKERAEVKYTYQSNVRCIDA